MKQLKIGMFLVVGLALCTSGGAAVITFDDVGLVHGEVVTTQIPGLTISVENFAPGHPDLGLAFDTGLTGTADPDLEGPAWAGGNLDDLDSLELGIALIIAENDVDRNGDDIIDDPDDEGRRPAGEITFDFDTAQRLFGFDLIDVEGVDDEPGQFAAFFMDGAPIQTVLFSDFLDEDSPFFQDAEFGNNTVNRIAPIDVGPFDRVVLRFGGSAAVDNLVLLPAPGALALFGLGLGALGLSRRRSRVRRRD